jgi:hypothetical protein
MGMAEEGIERGIGGEIEERIERQCGFQFHTVT